MKELTSENFKDIDEVAFVLVYSDKCTPCKYALKHYPKKHKLATVYKVDLDDELTDILEVEESPTACFVVKGKVISFLWGLQEPITVEGFIEKNYERINKRQLQTI